MEELNRLKNQSINFSSPLRIQKEVDYSEGSNAKWYPKEESPVLKELVENGILPSVESRVGNEPLVLSGIEKEGQYGGTMYKLKDLGGVRMEPVTLIRWSPQGYPLVPNVAKSFTVNEDATSFTFYLRRGMKWSDGHPFSANDILYWWESEQIDKTVNKSGPSQEFIHRGEPMKVNLIDDYTIQFTFCAPYPLFLERVASYPWMCASPKHFLEKFHPQKGNKELINKVMNQHNLINSEAVYSFARSHVEKPSLNPWIIRTEKITSPISYVRNPYFWAVDEKGRQLPYIDRIVVTDKTMDMLTISAAQGEVTMQARYIRNQDYTMLMKQRKQYGYQVYHLLNGDGSNFGISININRRFEPTDEESKQKAQLLKDKRFRQALSLAINRKAIVDAVYSGVAQPSQIRQPKGSLFYYDDFIDEYSSYDPDRANKLLDSCGLTERDHDGYRCFPGRKALLFDINYCSFTGEGPAEFVVNDWRKVGIKARLRPMERTIFYVEKSAGLHDFSVWGGYGAYLPILDPRYYFPYSVESNFAIKYGIWYSSGGMYSEKGSSNGARPPLTDPCYKAMELYENLKLVSSYEERKKIFKEILNIASENVYVLNFTTPLPALTIVKDGFKNVPQKAVYSWDFLSPSNLYPETWFWEKPQFSAKEFSDIVTELKYLKPIRPLCKEDIYQGISNSKENSNLSILFSSIIKYGLLISLILLIILFSIRSPYIAKRLLIMIPTLFLISVISFIIIDIPPGDAVTSKIIQLQEQGTVVDKQLIEDIKKMFRMEDPAWKRYTWWIGLDWFCTFSKKDEGLLQGNMGRSMLDFVPVNQKVGDRLFFTFLLSLGTILFTWLIALPIGVYSAVRQYSIFDYFFTFLGFIGMCIPGFLLALLLMFASERLFGANLSGLFSPEYAAQTGWTIGKFFDLLKHLWLPIFIQGITGTAGMIRVMRANLLDELKKPYVITAKAKGVTPLKLLIKYPVRVALNPFISGIGGIFPELISGGAIISIVMSLPTIGPMQLDAILQQDMFLAGSMLMVLSMLSVVGTLVSDLLLVIVDPRIRLEGKINR